LLLDAVASAVNQTETPEEILLVRDGGDHAETREACALAEQRYGVRLISCATHRGTSGARNTGFESATSDFVIPLDADDELPVNAVAAVGAALREAPDAEFVAGPYWLRSRSGSLILMPTSSVSLARLLAPVPRSFRTNWTLLGTTPISRDLWRRIGGYDEEFGIADLHDVEFWIRALSAARAQTFTREPHYTWRRRGGTNSAKVSVFSWARLASRHYHAFQNAGLEYRARELLLIGSAVAEQSSAVRTHQIALIKLALKGKVRPLSVIAASVPSALIRRAATRLQRT
jgi:glycosyltransferase involved in cell wall biosynthesis